jgi:hypothetical protein
MDYTYLTSLKNDFHSQLFPILSSSVYYQLKGLYKYSEQIHPKLLKKKKLSFDKVLKTVLSGFETLNNHEIEKQYYTVKMNSKCSDFFDNLVIASFKSYILSVTWDPETQMSKFTDNEFFKKISVKDFIHKCHVVSADYFITHSDVFMTKNKKDVLDIISSCIKIAMIKMIPYNAILNDYIENNFAVKISQSSGEIAKIKNLVNNFISNKKYGDIPSNNIIKQGDLGSDDDDDVNLYINAQADLNKFNAQLGNQNNVDALDDHSEITMSTAMSREDQKNKEIDNIMGDNDNIEADGIEDDEKEEKIEEKEEEYEEEEEEEEKIILNSPPVIRAKNRLGDLGVKNKLTMVSNKKLKNNKFDEMDKYYNSQLKN